MKPSSNTFKREYNLLIGEQTAEEIKIQIGSGLQVAPRVDNGSPRSRHGHGLAKNCSHNLGKKSRKALSEPISQIVNRVKTVLEQTPPELAAEVVTRGIVLTGGGALLRGLDQLLQLETGVPVRIADDPLSAVALGTGLALDMLHVLHLDGM